MIPDTKTVKKVIKIEIPKVIWDSDLSIFNFRPIFRTWMGSIQDAINTTNKIHTKIWE